MSNFCCGKDRWHEALGKAMVTSMVTGWSLPAAETWLVWKGYPRPPRGEHFPVAGINGTGRNPWGDFSTPGPPGACSLQDHGFHPDAVALPSWPSSVCSSAALPSPGRNCRTLKNAVVWPVSHSSLWATVSNRSPSPMSRRRLKDRRRTVPQGLPTREEKAHGIG